MSTEQNADFIRERIDELARHMGVNAKDYIHYHLTMDQRLAWTRDLQRGGASPRDADDAIRAIIASIMKESDAQPAAAAPASESATTTTQIGPAPGSEEAITQYLRSVGFELSRASVIARAILRLQGCPSLIDRVIARLQEVDDGSDAVWLSGLRELMTGTISTADSVLSPTAPNEPSVLDHLRAIAANVRNLEAAVQAAATNRTIPAAVVINFERLLDVTGTLANILSGSVGCSAPSAPTTSSAE